MKYFYFLSDWLTSSGHSEDFEHLSLEDLNELLEICWAEIRSHEGKSLSPSTFVSIRSGLNRYMKNPPFKRNLFIMGQPEFTSSNKMFLSVVKRIKQNGGDQTKHYPSIANDDLEKLKSPSAFDLNSPKQLQEKIFFYIQFNFARRGRENLRQLKKYSFSFHHDDKDLEYCEMAYNERTKNHQNPEQSESKPRMYATGKDTCPVMTLKLFMSKLPDNCEILYVQAKTGKNFSVSDSCWYTMKPIGINTLGNFMKTISKRLGLSIHYSNHSIWATVVTLLSSKGLEARQIMRLTKHKSESSLRSYESDNTVTQKRIISKILNSEPVSKEISTHDNHNNSHFDLESLSTVEIIDSNSSSNSNTAGLVQNQSQPSTKATSAVAAPFAFSNCQNCTFNIYYKK